MGHDCHTQYVIGACFSKYHTGVLVLEWSKNVHQLIFDHIMNEVPQLCTPKLCYCSDAQLNLLGHGSVTSKLISCVTTYKSTLLTSCNLCYKSKMRHCQSGQPMHQCNTCTGWDIYHHPKASTYCELLHGYPTTQMSNIDHPMHRTANEQHLVLHQSSFEWLSHDVHLAEMEARLSNLSKG